MNRLLAAVLSMALSGAAMALGDDPPTVGSTTWSNGRADDSWFVVRTPTTFRIVPSAPVKPDPALALEQYDRLVELKSDPETHAEALRRAADLRVQYAEVGDGRVRVAEVRKAIALYERLIAEHPADARLDLALYQLARAHMLLDEDDAGIAALARLGRQYPASPRAADGMFRAGELLYRGRRFAEAEDLYARVVALGTASKLFEPAQTKYGWTLFQESKYEEAIGVFFAILERELPHGDFADPSRVAQVMPASKVGQVEDALHVVSLSFAALGGGGAVNRRFSSGGEPRFSTLVYAALGETLLEQQRYTDAVAAWSAFVDRHPAHALAPDFQARGIAAAAQGGFEDLVVRGKEAYVAAYAPDAAYWGGRPPRDDVLHLVRGHLDDLGAWYHARAQRPSAEPAARVADLDRAAAWYRRTLDLFPKDPKADDVRMAYADALFDAGHPRQAAEQYATVAASTGPRAPEASYASVQAWQRLATTAPATASAALRASVTASLALADRFPAHPHAAEVLAQAAEDLYALKDYDQAIAVAERTLHDATALPAALRRQALGVTADARFAQGRYPDAEAAYSRLLQEAGTGEPQRAVMIDRLASAVYRQGEAARDSGDLRAAAAAFLRVGRSAPDAAIRSSADYDAAAALFALEDWAASAEVLEGFRTRFPGNPLVADADRKLALAYEKSNQPTRAAEALLRIAQRTSEPAEARGDAAWLAAQLYDRAVQPGLAASAYEGWLMRFGGSLDRGLQARRRLADLARDTQSNQPAYVRWLRDLVATEDSGGAARTDATRLMAAQACLEIGRIDAATARGLVLTLPAQASLPRRKAATQIAIASLSRAAAFDFADVTTAATYELGLVYRDLGDAVMHSERPRGLDDLAREQYDLLLEEQAFPFEEQAIAAHEANLARMRQGLWNDWIRRSVHALGELSPGKYGKNEKGETSYDTAL